MDDETRSGSPNSGNGATDVDSDPVEEVDSGEDFSRLIRTPSNAHETHLAAKSTPQMAGSPRKLLEAKAIPAIAFDIPSPISKKPESVPRSANFGPNSRDTQQTQPVAPLTSTQLDRLMDGLSDIDDQGEINSSSENEPDESRVSRLDSLGNVDLAHPGGLAPSLAAGDDFMAVGSSSSQKLRKERARSALNAVNPPSFERVLPKPTQSLHIDNSSDDADPNETPGVVSLEEIDETPIRMLNSPRYVYLWVKFGHDPRWWSCRAENEDWKVHNKRAIVLFRKNEQGASNLSSAFLLNLRIGDHVHIVKRPGRFIIRGLLASSDHNQDICAIDGANAVSAENAKRKVVVAVADLYLTEQDRRANQQTLGKVATNSLGAANQPQILGDQSNKLPSFGTLTPRRRSRPQFVASPDQDQEIRSSPARSSPERAKLGSTSINASLNGPFNHDFRLPLHDIDFDDNYLRSPPRKRRDLALKSAALRRENQSKLFSSTFFSITLDDVATNQRTSLAKSPILSKSQLIELITLNGGRVLDNGLSDILQLSELNQEGSMPDLVVHADADTSYFGAVLADEPRRTVKYLEMVALGWPCLHFQYIVDCIQHGKLLNWLPYLLPAGRSTVPSRNMEVSANCHAFHQRWLRKISLKEQIRRRQVAIRCAVPFCLLKNEKTPVVLLLLAALCAPQFGVWIYNRKNMVPNGSLVVNFTAPDGSDYEVMTPDQLYAVENDAALAETQIRNKEWLIQCIINRSLI